MVQETEYTGAGKHPTAQLTFARENGVKVMRGPSGLNIPGEVIAIPESRQTWSTTRWTCSESAPPTCEVSCRVWGTRTRLELTEDEIKYLAAETHLSVEQCLRLLTTCRI